MSTSNYNLSVFKTIDGLNKAAAAFIMDAAHDAIAARGRFVISLSGGQTPAGLYKLLATTPYKTSLPWKNIFIFWGDERCVPLDDERNNAYQAKRILLDGIEIPPKNIHRIQTNLAPEQAAIAYEKEISSFFKGAEQRFDLILLGLGENGHTASIFPGTDIINEKAEAVRAVYVTEEKKFRVSMTAPLINQAHQILFLVTGISKAMVLKNVLTGTYQPAIYPAQLIKPFPGMLNWFTDEGASSLLQNE
ncbi:MAG: 6-phosphogluconolactonase [Ferruginibacter sp.]|nr:6-phosphogluconolactonase [Bacteroidota bacterium]MBX2919581.1 6-phosphogluconolactonase [Ferruginibacter sp.]MCB0707946.1 6-phosphogluconolactonase [Chitinophagaceae bacterium]